MSSELENPLLSIQLGYFALSLFFCALFSFLETAVTALRLFNLNEIAKSTRGYKHLLTTLEKEPQRVLIAILIANSVADVMSAALITRIMENFFKSLDLSEGLGFTLGIVIATATTLLIGEVIPKNIAQAHGPQLFKSTLWLTNITFIIMSPLVNVLSKLSNFIVTLVKNDGNEDSTETYTSEKEIQFLIDYINKKGMMDTDKTQMLHSIFDLGHTTVKEIMVPETDIITVNVSTSLPDALELFSRCHFSRLPVYEGEDDNIIGMLHQKDAYSVLLKNEQKNLQELVRPILFVPESMKVNQLLRQFKQQRHHIAMVLNEYGGIIGLVTLEDAIEEIVGEINDEHESVPEAIVPLEQGGWLVYAGVDLDKLEKLLNIRFDCEDAVTLGGFLTEKLQHLPKKGGQLSYSGYVFQVQKSSEKRVFQVLIFKDVIPDSFIA
jgi:putative hemolysin